MSYRLFFVGIILFCSSTVFPVTTFASRPTTSNASRNTQHYTHTKTLEINSRNHGVTPTNCIHPCSIETKVSNSAQSISFAEMWSLIVKHHQTRESHFTPELIACLFWEESGFRLVEHPRSHAAGFGQVLPSNLAKINQRFHTRFTRTSVMSSPDESVEAAILALELAYDWKKNNLAALHGYAGRGSPNARAVKKWLLGERELMTAKLPYAPLTESLEPAVQLQIVAALDRCSQPGFDPEILFEQQAE